MSLRLLSNFFRMALDNASGHPPIYSPVRTSLYVTHRCNLNCEYCDNGSGHSFPKDPIPEMDTKEVIKVLKIIRKENDVITLTGGEPTVRRDIVDILKAITDLKFRFVSINTNGVLAREKKEIFDHLNFVLVSFDTFNEERSDKRWRASKGTTEKVKKNIEWLIHLRKKKGFKLLINSVIAPENIKDVYEIMRYCDMNRITFSTGPAIDRYYPNESLPGNPEYIALMNEIIRRKKKGQKILGTVKSYKTMRDFSKFKCFPTGVLRINPSGDLIFPCNRLKQKGPSLLKAGSVKEAIRIAYDKYGYQPLDCDNRCHFRCYIDNSLKTRYPLIVIPEGFFRTRGMLRNALR